MPIFKVLVSHFSPKCSPLTEYTLCVKSDTREELEERLRSLSGGFIISSPIYKCFGCNGRHKFFIEETTVHNDTTVVDVSSL